MHPDNDASSAIAADYCFKQAEYNFCKQVEFCNVSIYAGFVPAGLMQGTNPAQVELFQNTLPDCKSRPRPDEARLKCYGRRHFIVVDSGPVGT